MKSSTVLFVLALAGSSIAAPVADKPAPTPTPPQDAFLMQVLNSWTTKPINTAEMQARNGRIWVGGKTNAPCPSDYPTCGKGGKQQNTIFWGGQDDEAGSSLALYLDVEAATGQQVYAMPDGEVRYTMAGNKTMPAEASSAIFLRTGADGSFMKTFFNDDYQDWLACPKGEKPHVQYQVYLWPNGEKKPKGCIEFGANLHYWSWVQNEYAASQYN